MVQEKNKRRPETQTEYKRKGKKATEGQVKLISSHKGENGKIFQNKAGKKNDSKQKCLMSR